MSIRFLPAVHGVPPGGIQPVGKERRKWKKAKGFNVEMPSPEDSEMEGNQVSAYEQEALAKKKWRRGTFQEMSHCSARTVRILPVLPQEKQTAPPELAGKGKAPAPSVPLRSLQEYEPFAGHCIYPK
ncbi:hypothetical protein NXW50_10490 [Bacteroides thetaiotaomicron]|nr:hypothetical protein [Bacteroides thetaiotaomicron]MCS2278610.1 hypothetical protein [Bacteroides thetaiotaomicron]